MPDEVEVYKSCRRFSYLPSCSLDFVILKKVFEAVKAKTEEAANIEASTLKKADNQSDEDFDKLKKYLVGLYKVTIQILGEKGDYRSSESSSIFDSNDLPDFIDSIIFDNSYKYKFQLNRDPLNKIRISFDFRRASVLDLVTSPSLPTPNENSILVIGGNETWVDGTYRKVLDVLEGHKNNYGWLHKRNIYDFFLIVVFAPISFRLIYLFDRVLRNNKVNVSSVFLLFLYFYTFLITLNVFRVIFNYARWIFPNNELKTTSNKPAIHRAILWVILLAILGTAICDIIGFAWRFLR